MTAQTLSPVNFPDYNNLDLDSLKCLYCNLLAENIRNRSEIDRLHRENERLHDEIDLLCQNNRLNNRKPQKKEFGSLESYFKDRTKAKHYSERLITKVKEIVALKNKGYAKEAMLYVYACEKADLFGGKQIPYLVIEKELGITSSVYYNYRKGGSKCDYTEKEVLDALKYIQGLLVPD